jgi:energy-coupling factor transport system ATP-binding protein
MQSLVLVLDEPTSDLDPVGTQEVLAVLRQLNKEFHMTIVLIEHKIDEIVPWVDRVILLDQGRVITDASPRQAFADSTQWRSRGVAVPQVVQLAQVLPDVFPDTTPLSVVEAYDALHDSPYAQIIRARNTARQQLNITPLVDSQTSNASSDPTSILAWEHVSLSYGAKQVLKDINLHVAAHEWLAIVGTNGSGKTSLASLAMGFQKPTQGVAYNHGKAVKAGKISLQAEKTAYLFQAADSMLFTESVEKEFLFGTQHRRTQRQAADVPFTVEQLLDIVDLKSYRTDNPFHLSHGQRKRLALGALLTRYPDTVILDEPTTGQDEGHARAFLQFLQQVQARHQLTYVMITHHMEAVANYATRMVVLKDGNIFMDDTPHRVFAHPDALATCGIIPPPIAQLYAQLCAGQAGYVELNVPDFLQALQIEKVVL